MLFVNIHKYAKIYSFRHFMTDEEKYGRTAF